MGFGVSRGYSRRDSARVGWFLVLVVEGMRENCRWVNFGCTRRIGEMYKLNSSFISFKSNFMFDSSAYITY